MILACVAIVPVAAFGQAAIGGVVSDPSGAPMAGVVVEASSAALIEKTRITVTDRSRPVPHRGPATRDVSGSGSRFRAGSPISKKASSWLGRSRQSSTPSWRLDR